MCASQKLVVDKCDKCLSDIKTHTNDVMGMFEIHADNLFDNFNHTAKISLEAMEAQTNGMMIDHLKKQGAKHDEEFKSHLEIQTEKNDIKYNEYLDRKDKRESRNNNILVAIMLLFAGVISYCLAEQKTQGNDMIRFKTEIESKPSRKEIPLMNEIKMLRELGDQYNDAKFVRREKVTADTSSYYWARINIYGSTMRGEQKENNYMKEDYMKVEHPKK